MSRHGRTPRLALPIAVALVTLLTLAPRPAAATNALRPAVATRGNYGESFTFVADLDDGTYVQLSFGLTNLGPGSLKAVCRAVVVPPGANPWRPSLRVGRDEWKWSDGQGEQLVIGPCSASVNDDVTTVEVPLEGGAVRLRLTGRATRRVPADAAVAVDNEYYRYEILLYRSHVEGTIQLPGAPARPVTGGGYLDHTRSTIKPKDLADRWVRFRALRGDRGAVVLGRRGHDGRFTPVWSCDPPGHCRHFESFQVERSGTGTATQFRIRFPSDLGDPLDIASGPLLYRDDPMSDLGVVGKLATPFFGAPVTYVYRGRLTAGKAPPIEGILEVELSSE